MATEILHENNGYGEKLWEQVCDELQHHHKQQLERRVEQAAHQARYQWRRWHIAHALPRTRGVHALRLHASLFHSLWWHRTPHSSSSERIHTSICMVIHGAPSLIRLLPFLLPFPLVCHRLPLPPRAVRWAPLHDGHGKPAQLRCRREWGHPERLHLSHRLWAQPPGLRRAQRLISSLLLHDPFTDQDVDDVTLGEMLTAAHRGQVDYCVPGGISVSQSSSAMFDQGNLMEWEWSIDQGNLMSVTARTHRLGLYLKSKDRRLSRNIVKKSVITNSMQLTQKKSADSYKDNYGDRKLEFREAHQQSLTEMDELRKFQSSTFDTIARRKLIEDQNTTLALSGRVQEFQYEVNCINDSEDFQDAESVRSGNSHVTSRPVSFPPHPIPEEMLRHSFVSPSRKEGPPSIWDTHGISETFLQIHMHNHQLLILKNCINGIRQSKGRSIHPQWRKVKGKNKIKIWDASQDRQPKIQSSSVAETLQRIMEQTNNDCRFWIFTLTSSLHQQPLLAGR